MNLSEKLIKIINDLLVDESLDIKILPTSNNMLIVDINGTQYGYSSKTIDLKELERKFRKMLTFSAGKALAWLKKNAEHEIGGTK